MNIFRRLKIESAIKTALLTLLLPLFLLNISVHAENRDLDFSQAELDQILAPIALYPDTLLSQVLMAATYPIEVVQANRWASTHPDLKGEEAVNAVNNKEWDPSVKALVAFPDLLDRMSDDLDWTQKLGDAFLSDEHAVMDTVQSLRKKAYASGSLKNIQHLRIDRDEDDIIIEPAEERIVYVPVYDTRIVYGSWWWPDYQPVFWHYPSSYVFVRGFYWGPRAYIGSNYFYSSCHWRQRSLVVVNYHNTYAIDRPHFYTSRSIINYSDARPWQHNPIHRHGVAYYNDRLSVTYGSHRPAYQNNRSDHERRYDRNYLDHHPEHNRSGSNGVQFNSGIEHRNNDVVQDNQRRDDHHRDNHQERDHDDDERTSSPQRNAGNIEHFNDEQDRDHRNNWNRNRNDQRDDDWRSRNNNTNQTNTETRPAWESNGQHNRLQAGSDHQSATRTFPTTGFDSNNHAERSQRHQQQEQQNRSNDQENTRRTEDSRSRTEVHVDNQMNRRIEGGRNNQPRRGRDDDKDK